MKIWARVKKLLTEDLSHVDRQHMIIQSGIDDKRIENAVKGTKVYDIEDEVSSSKKVMNRICELNNVPSSTYPIS